MSQETIDTAAASLRYLIAEARQQNDATSWAANLLRDSNFPPEDKYHLIEALSAAGRLAAKEAMASSELPRCSFCLKSSAYVLAMVSSPSANICNECSEIVRVQLSRKRRSFRFLLGRMALAWRKITRAPKPRPQPGSGDPQVKP